MKSRWIDWFQMAAIVMLGPFFLFPKKETVWIFLFLPLILLVQFFIKGRFFESSFLDWPIFLLTFQVLITCLVVSDTFFSLPKIMGVLFGVILFFASLALFNTRKIIRLGIVAFLGGSFIFSIIGALGMIRANPKSFDKLYKISTLVPQKNFHLPGAEEGFHPNAVGGTMALIVPIFLIFVFTSLWKKDKACFLFESSAVRYFLMGGAFITSSVLLLTQSRGSWAGIIVASWLVLLPNWKWKKWGLVFILIFIIGIGLMTESIPQAYKSAEARFNERMQLFRLGVEIIGEHPLTGIGMNHVRKLPEVEYSEAHLHNHLIHTAAELGIPALVAYLAILIGAGWMCYKVWLESNVGWMRAAALGLGAGQLAHFIFGLGDSIPLGAKPGIFFWFSLALIAAMFNYMKRKEIAGQDL